MVDAAVKFANLGQFVRHGSSTDSTIREQAFRLWIENARSFRRVSELTGLNDRTLRDWHRGDTWEQRRLDQAQSFLPGASTETAISMRLACMHAAARLQQIAWESNELGTKPDYRETMSLLAIVNTATSTAPPQVSQPTPELPDFSAMSNEELRAYQQSLRQRRRTT